MDAARGAARLQCFGPDGQGCRDPQTEVAAEVCCQWGEPVLAADSPDGRVHVGSLGSYLRRTDPAFSPQTYDHSGLVNMLKTYDLLSLRQEAGGHWTVALAAPKEAGEVSGAADAPI